MALTVLTGDAIQFFVVSGWRQFYLDGQFALSSPCNSLTELCNIPSSLLAGNSFVDLFSASGREELHRRLLQLAAVPAQPISSMCLDLQSDSRRSIPVEIMLYPAPEVDTQHRYIGFIRSIPDTILNFRAENKNVAHQLGLKIRQFETVAQLGHHIASILDSDALLEYAVESLCRDFEYEYTSIFSA